MLFIILNNINLKSFSTNFQEFPNMKFVVISKASLSIWASALDIQQCGVCDQQSLRSACAYAQSGQSLC